MVRPLGALDIKKQPVEDDWLVYTLTLVMLGFLVLGLGGASQ